MNAAQPLVSVFSEMIFFFKLMSRLKMDLCSVVRSAFDSVQCERGFSDPV